MKIVKTLLLLLPLNVIAHPGHAEMATEASFSSILIYGIAFVALLPLLNRLIKRQRRD